MADRQGELLIQVRTGVGEPSVMATVPGEAMGPMSVGHSGAWRVVALGVRDEHAFLYFDGSTLYVQSIDDDNPAFVNSAPVLKEWTSVQSGSEIALGDARLWYGPPQPRPEAEQRAPSPPRLDKLDRPFPPGAFVNEDSVRRVERPFGAGGLVTEDSDVTRIAPLEEGASAISPPLGGPPRPAAGGAAPFGGPPRPAAGVAPRGGGTVQMAALPVALAAGAGGRAAPPGLVVSGGSNDATVQVPVVAPQMMHPSMTGPAGMASMPVTTVGPIGPPPSYGGVSPMGPMAPMGPMGMGPGMQPGMPPQQAPSYPAGPPGQDMSMYATGSPAAATGPQAAAPAAAPSGKPSIVEQAKAQWKAAPAPRKAIIVLALPVLVSVFFILTYEPPRPPPRPRPNAAATTAPTGTAVATTATAPTAGPVDTSLAGPPTPTASAGSTDPRAPASGMPSATPTAQPTAVAVAPSATATAKPTKPGAPPSKKTLQRAAADAVAAGAWVDAATLYEQLARMSPDQPAYAEAARIMRQKAAGK
jgi:hypothetical protein